MTTRKSALSILLVLTALGMVLSGATVLVQSKRIDKRGAAERGEAALKASKGLGQAKLLNAAFVQTCNTVSNVTTCTENSNIAIPGSGTGDPNNGAAASPYPSNIVVSGVSGTVNKVTLKLNNLSHTSADDMDMMLVGPNGQNVFFWSDSGGTATVISNQTYTIDDNAASNLPDNGPIPGGTYRPTNNFSANNSSNNDHFPAPAPAPSALTSFGAAFNGISPNGTWALYITDDATGDTGAVAGGWTLEITVGAAAAATTTTVTSSQPDYSLSGSAVTFTATVVKTSDSSSVGAVGSVTFKDGATNLTCTEGAQPRPLNASGQATCTTSALSIGNHTINADYTDGATFLSSSGSVTQVVDGPTTNPVANKYCNTANIAIPQSGGTSGVASPYPSHINVTGLTGNISKVTVELDNFSHSIPDDVDMLLVSPTGQNLVIMSDVGGTTPASNVTLTLDDAAASSLPDGTALSSGTFKPTNGTGTGTETYPAPAPAASGNTTLAGAFNGISPNGVWRLYIVDDAGGDVGALAGGWCLTFTTTNDVATSTTVTSSQPDFSTTGQPVTFTATVIRTDTNAPVTVGTVTFKEGTTNLTCAEGSQPRPLNGSGQATCTTSALGVGNHTITADYSGVPGQFNLSSGNFVQVVDTPTVQTGNEFCNNGTISIPSSTGGAISGAPASPYPSHVTVSGLTGTITNLTVELNNFTHTNPDDVDFLLVSPSGQSLVLVSDVGGSGDVSNVTLTLDDAAASSLPDNGPLVSGTFKPTNSGAGDTYPAPAPAPSGATTLAGAFNGINPNGVWRLYIVDDAGGDIGSLGGWCLNITVPSSVSVNDASLSEPASGSNNMLFTVVVTPVPTAPVSVDFSTAPGGANPATPGSDYTPTTGTLNFAAGQSVQTISVPVLADADNTETNETFLVNLSNATGAAIDDGQATGTILTAPAGQTAVVISEFRASGPGGINDEFIELANRNTSATADISGWGVFKRGASCSATPILVATIPASTVIPAGGHYLITGSAYSLGSYAASNLPLASPLEDDVNLGLFSTANVASLTSATRIDGVGFVGSTGNNCDLLREGSGLSTASGSTSQYSFVRLLFTGVAQDTNDNASDFMLVSTTPNVAVGSTSTPRHGAPGPENITSPRMKFTDQIMSLLLDPAQAESVSPNRTRDANPYTDTLTPSAPNGGAPASNPYALGTLSVQRRFVNATGAPVSRLRFRVVDITTVNSPYAVGSGVQADVRLLSSNGVTRAPASLPAGVSLKGLTLEQPPTQPFGGGWNSTVAAGTITLANQLPATDNPGTTQIENAIDVQFLLGVATSGKYRFFIIIEALP